MFGLRSVGVLRDFGFFRLQGLRLKVFCLGLRVLSGSTVFIGSGGFGLESDDSGLSMSKAPV